MAGSRESIRVRTSSTIPDDLPQLSRLPSIRTSFTNPHQNLATSDKNHGLDENRCVSMIKNKASHLHSMINSSLIPTERIESKIYFIRGKKVMFDRDLASLYEVTTGRFNEQVKRNSKRFPDDDFMFQLTKLEFENFKGLISQNAISKRGGTQKRPFVFTEQGVAMLSSILNSERAIQVNIQIIKTFTRLRQLIATNQKLSEKIEQMEKKYDEQFKVVFEVMNRLLAEEEKPKRRIGFGVE